jgi:hypothetical protein
MSARVLSFGELSRGGGAAEGAFDASTVQAGFAGCTALMHVLEVFRVADAPGSGLDTGIAVSCALTCSAVLTPFTVLRA